MKIAVSEVYAHIIRFLIRARDWYHESNLLHLLHSITRPVELRYKDLIDKIMECSRIIDYLALSGTQAELRSVHKKVEVVLSEQERSGSVLAEMKALLIGKP